ncbi:MAG: YegS/Rv2252/BmrU family lipid kinase [Pseudobutyrivibrio sp.]|nr:YegS/Rv2252/BmrU family lipid kinase [Pseudobutyrivibrio sp.]
MANGRRMMFEFIVNKNSGSGAAAAAWDELESLLKTKNVEYNLHVTERVGHATKLAHDITSVDEDIKLVVFGGDGTLNEVINGIRDFERVELGYIPSGSANDFSRGVGLIGSHEDILNRILENDRCVRVDLGQVDTDDGRSRLFCVSSGIGVDALVCKQVDEGRLKKLLNRFNAGSAAYGITTVGDIFTMPFADATITYNGHVSPVRGVIFAAAMNGAYEGGGIPMVPYAKPTSSQLSAVVAHDIPRIFCFEMLLKLIKGKHRGCRGIDFFDFHVMNIVMDRPMCVHADGEIVGFHKTVVFRCLPSKLKLRGL